MSARRAALRRWTTRLSLQTRLVAGAVVLTLVGLLVADVTAVGLLRQNLVQRVDQQLLSFTPGLLPNAQDSGASSSANGRRELPSRYVVTQLDSSGTVTQVFATSGTAVPRVPRLTSAGATRLDQQNAFVTYPAKDGSSAPYRSIVRVDPFSGTTFVVSLSLGEVQSTTRQLEGILAAVSAGVLLLIAGLGTLVVRLGLRPLAGIERTAGRIAAGDLSRRVRDHGGGSEVDRLARSLNVMLAQIEDAFAERAASQERLRRFVADASHELRTPLTSIRGYAELYRLGAARDPADLPRLFGRIEDESRRMGALVDDLLALARLDQHRAVERTPVDLAVLADDAVSDASAVARDRRITLSGDGEGPYVVLGEEPRLRQVLANLVGNALAHTAAGTPVDVRLARTGVDGSQQVVVEVADEGQGMPPEVAARVFERFFRADPSRNRENGGAGLGLSIVAAQVEAHGGRVSLDSAPGRGSRFKVVLPAA